jgi:hypothetical protein
MSKHTTLQTPFRLSVFEDLMLSGALGPKRGEVTGEWRKLRNEELNLLAPEFGI